MNDQDLKKLAEVITQANNKEEPGLASGKNFNILAMGIIAAAGALVWNVVAPTANFGELQNQTTEIRTAVLEMKTVVTDLSQKMDKSQEQASQQQSKIAALETTVEVNRQSIEKLHDQVSDLERSR